MTDTNKDRAAQTAPAADAANESVSVDHRIDQIAANWEQQVGSAKVLWGKLTDDELLKTEGKLQRLKGLVQERYALTEDAAEKQVEAFMTQFKAKE